MSQYYFYSIFNMSSCRKPEIQDDLPKITQNQVNLICFLTNRGQKTLTMFVINYVLTTIQLNFKNSEI